MHTAAQVAKRHRNAPLFAPREASCQQILGKQKTSAVMRELAVIYQAHTSPATACSEVAVFAISSLFF
jgi:hypothetical protein